MTDLDLYVRAVHDENRLRYSAGDVVGWLPSGSSPGAVVASSDCWRIIRVTGLSEIEADMLTASDPATIADEARAISPRRRMYKLPLREWLSGTRDKNRATLYDCEITSDELFAKLILKDEELRDETGRPLITPEPDHAIGRDNR